MLACTPRRWSFSEVCSNAGAHFIGVVEQLLAAEIWMTQVMAGDGAHPSAEGYRALADLILAEGWTHWLRADARSSVRLPSSSCR
jgi:acyl-CoA thioesterase-1